MQVCVMCFRSYKAISLCIFAAISPTHMCVYICIGLWVLTLALKAMYSLVLAFNLLHRKRVEADLSPAGGSDMGSCGVRQSGRTCIFACMQVNRCKYQPVNL